MARHKSGEFAKKRKLEGRALSEAVDALSEAVKRAAGQAGIDVNARLAEVTSKRLEVEDSLIKRLLDPVAPLLVVDQNGRPAQLGSSVLVRFGGREYAFTAAHVIREAGGESLFSCSEAHGGKIVPLPYCTANLLPSTFANDYDVAVIPLPKNQTHCFSRRVFLTERDIDLEDTPVDQSITSDYLVLGYPAARSRFKVKGNQIEQTSFNLSTMSVSAAEYVNEGLSPEMHLALEYNHKDIRVHGKTVNGPKLQGVSGGGIFQGSHFSESCKLVGIATQNRRATRLIIGTGIKYFLHLAL